MTLGEKIRYYRHLNNISQDELGKKIRSDARTISNYETEKYKPSVDTIILIAKAFGVTIDELLDSQGINYLEDTENKKEWLRILSKLTTLPKKDQKVIKDLVECLLEKAR